MEKVRGRFAPTPSGWLHLGNAWTALWAWLHARQANGSFILRMEDIDLPRCKPEYAAQILDDLRWLGLDWDEGPDVGGPFAPYAQRARSRLYLDALARLRRDGRLYPCFCSRAELLAIARAPHGLGSEGPAYPGTCRRLTPAEQADRARRKRPAWRFAMPDAPISFDDLVLGPQSFPPGAGGDFIVERADGVIAYQLAVVVDDAAMAVTHVVRGADLLDSTPRQIWLYDALGLPAPRFAHVPLLLGPDGRRLAKRDATLTLPGLRAHGVAPERVVGLLAHCAGLSETPEPLRPADLLPHFRLHRLPREPVRLPAGFAAWLGAGAT
ncbi:glutamyl-Q tRNA(Asp) synthetase [Alicyclobacillus cellulosilyticus]|uniref:Glutamyl-Q tRNA(Asp) synthetase n=1 Tax=Alicyclobacillus cellulosilyticus TaxID=1003997 RepID=A0A917KBW9_9BACL|nr:tRNA glutamyl-Q(34) synthetase GluQRS [Alicyclobacillus cellulosilyticus]GGJ06917.1 glutamyl-Q tRNA(Asp) synthetase [Alicyclobacillus cellulosilyticus]